MIYALDGQRPQIDPDSWIAPDANLIGRVDIRAGGSQDRTNPTISNRF